MITTDDVDDENHNNATTTTVLKAPTAEFDTVSILMLDAEAERYAPKSGQSDIPSTAKWTVCTRVPWFVLVLSAVQCLAFLVCMQVEPELLYLDVDAQKPHQIWRYLSYSMVHVNCVHLGINVSLQLLVGAVLEAEQGLLRPMLVYVLGVYGGARAAAHFQPQRRLAGGSAGVFALLLSHVPHTALNFAHLPYRHFRPVAIVVLCLSDGINIGRLLAAGLVVDRFFDRGTITISVVAHIGGAVAGLLGGLLLYAAPAASSKTCAVLVVFLRLGSFAGIIVIVILMHLEC